MSHFYCLFKYVHFLILFLMFSYEAFAEIRLVLKPQILDTFTDKHGTTYSFSEEEKTLVFAAALYAGDQIFNAENLDCARRYYRESATDQDYRLRLSTIGGDFVNFENTKAYPDRVYQYQLDMAGYLRQAAKYHNKTIALPLIILPNRAVDNVLGHTFTSIQTFFIYSSKKLGIDTYINDEKIEQDGFFIWLNAHHFDLRKEKFFEEVLKWAGVISHEMLHGLGHLHPGGDYSYRYFINSFTDCVHYRRQIPSYLAAHKMPCGRVEANEDTINTILKQLSSE